LSPPNQADGGSDEPALPDGRDLTSNVEDYLKAIYELETRGGAEGAGKKEIAIALGIAAPSVTGMMRRLAEMGLIQHEPYRGVRLSDQGRRAALRTIRRHRILECYLTSRLGYSWDRVHDEAERLEHSASDELIERMAEALGEPVTDPHGAPIPTREGSIDERSLSSLDSVPVGAAASVARVSDRDGDRLRYLAELGIRPGVAVTVQQRAPFHGPLTVAVGGESHVISEMLARAILVEPS
jgi:DtxR family Mn-dependent transcriptional regulator